MQWINNPKSTPNPFHFRFKSIRRHEVYRQIGWVKQGYVKLG